MSIFQSTTELSWPLPLKTNAGRQPPFIMTIGEAANFAEDEIRLGLADDALWRQCFARLAAAYDSPDSQLLVTQATRATQPVHLTEAQRERCRRGMMEEVR